MNSLLNHCRFRPVRPPVHCRASHPVVTAALLALLACATAGYSQDAARSEAPQGVAAASSPPPMPVQVIFESAVGDVAFPHNLHLKFGCVACHHQIRAGELDTPHPGYMNSSWVHCQTCHDADAQTSSPYYKCSHCHQSEPENIADETLSAKVVVHQSCWKCHESGTGVDASRGCGDCHVKEEKTAEAPNG